MSGTLAIGRNTVRSSALIAVVAGGLWWAGCGGGAAEPPASATPPAPAAATGAPPASPAAEPKSAVDLFPDGPQKAAVVNNCASCHNLACSVIGQRTPERWDSLQKSHADLVPGADVAGMFAYLKANFDSTKAEPKVPPAFLEGGCTPF
jgi:hypothetical protein